MIFFQSQNIIVRFLIASIICLLMKLASIKGNNYLISLIVLLPLLSILIVMFLKSLYRESRTSMIAILSQMLWLGIIADRNCFTKK